MPFACLVGGKRKGTYRNHAYISWWCTTQRTYDHDDDVDDADDIGLMG